MKTSQKKIFLDHASTTPVDKRVLAVMTPFFSKFFQNPSSLYESGVFAKKSLDDFRQRVARVLKTHSDEIVFTGSGTESVNLAILGVFESFSKKDFKPHIIVSQFEHPAVLESARKIEKLGGTVTHLPVSKDGFVDPKDLRKSLNSRTVLVSIMHANNEIGTIQPIALLAKEIRNFKRKQKKSKNPIYFHTDASQSANYLEISPTKIGVDLMTIDASKIYGPKGVGALFVKRGINLEPQILGGGQEGGLRSGTENIAGIAGLTKALEIAQKEKEVEFKRLTKIRDYAISEILKSFPEASLNGSIENRLPNNINICFPDIDGEFAVIKLDALGFMVSSSSSCSTISENSYSYVIESLGKKKCATSSIRITLGRETQKSHLKSLIKALSFLA